MTQGKEGDFDPMTAQKMLEFTLDISRAKEPDVLEWLDSDPDLKAFLGDDKDDPPPAAPSQA